LSETIAAGGSVLVLDPGQYSTSPGKRLMGEIVDFGIDARSRSAVVTFDALLAEPGGATISKKRFSASVPVSDIDSESVGRPLNQAANKVAGEIAAWVAEGS
jgi:cholesterol transport system auxiliary component